MMTSNRAKVLLRAETNSAKINNPGAKGERRRKKKQPSYYINGER